MVDESTGNKLVVPALRAHMGDWIYYLYSAPEPLTFFIFGSSFTLVLYPLGLTLEGVCGIFRGNTLLSRRIP